MIAAELHTHSLCAQDRRLIELLLRYNIDYTVQRHDNQAARTQIFDHLGLVGRQRTLPKVALLVDEQRFVMDRSALLCWLLANVVASP